MSNSEGMHSPVEQFEIKPLVELSLGGYDVSFTNSSLFMLLAIGVSAKVRNQFHANFFRVSAK